MLNRTCRPYETLQQWCTYRPTAALRPTWVCAQQPVHSGCQLTPWGCTSALCTAPATTMHGMTWPAPSDWLAMFLHSALLWPAPEQSLSRARAAACMHTAETLPSSAVRQSCQLPTSVSPDPCGPSLPAGTATRHILTIEALAVERHT